MKKSTLKKKVTTIPETELKLIPETVNSFAEHYLECILSDRFITEFDFSPDSKIYKIIEIYSEPVPSAVKFKSAHFGINEDFIDLTEKIQTASKKNNLINWIQEDNVAFLFEGWASPPSFKKDTRPKASLPESNYYLWDKESNCLMEADTVYTGQLIQNEDLPILRACKTAQYFMDSLRTTVPDIDFRTFPVAKKINDSGTDDQDQRIVNIYIIAKPQRAVVTNR